VIDFAIWAGVLLLALFALVRGADVFMLAAESLGLAYGLSPFIIGVTIVAIGTSLPELMSGIAAVWSGASEIAAGTAIGSNVTNILLVLGAAALIGRGLRVDYELVRVDLPFLFGSALLLTLFASDGAVGRGEALLGLTALAVYLVYAAGEPERPQTTVAAAAAEFHGPESTLGWRVWLSLLGGAALVQLGATFTVESVVRLSELVGIGNEIIAASVIAVATSLPELSVTIRSARAGKPEIAVGNVIGSNIFNSLGVVGGAALFGEVLVPGAMLTFGLPSMIGATVLAFFVLQEREMTRWDGWLLLILYVAFATHLYGVL
jgi:cation:H+ antiporter